MKKITSQAAAGNSSRYPSRPRRRPLSGSGRRAFPRGPVGGGGPGAASAAPTSGAVPAVLVIAGPSVVAVGAGRGVLAVVEQERVLRAPGQLDPVAASEDPAPAGVLLEDLEL